MKKFRCPNCGKESIPLSAKISVTPGVVSAECPECNEPIYADYGTNPVCWIPVLAGCLLLRYFDSLIVKVIILAIFGAVSLAWYAFSAELITKQQYIERKNSKAKRHS